MTAACAAAVAFVPGPGWLAAALVLAGFGLAASEAGGNVLLRRDVEGSMMGTAFGLKQAAPPGAALVAGALVPVLAGEERWRWGYLGIGMLAMGTAPALVDI